KAYDDKTVAVRDLAYREFKTPGERIRNVASLEKVDERKVDSISWRLASQSNVYLMEYRGTLVFPRAGSYLFTLQTGGGGILVINRDTVVRHDGGHAFNEQAKGIYRSQGGI